MSDAAGDPSKGRTQRFRRAISFERLNRQELERQGAISRLAFEKLGRDGSIDFLNSFDTLLDGRPLAVATRTLDGFARVVAAINARAC